MFHTAIPHEGPDDVEQHSEDQTLNAATRSSPFPAGGGELGALIRAFDWSQTSIGPIEHWPQSLKTVTGMLLLSPVPIVLLWGEEGIMIYNDAYSVFAGQRHPQLLGSEVRRGWPEVADFNDHVMRTGLAGGTLAYQDQELTLYRHGRPEQVWMNLDYSPVLDEKGKPAGVIAIVVETTERVRVERRLREAEARLRFLDGLGKETAKSTDADEILAISTRMLGEYLGVSSCAYADMDPDENGFTIRGDWAAPGSRSIVGHYNLGDFGRLAVRNLSAGLPLIINDNLTEILPHEAATFQAIGITATICMPLVKEGQLTALMAVHDKVARRWTASEIALLTEVTERSWAHIERARSEAEVRLGEQRFRDELAEKVEERTAALRQAEQALGQVLKMEALGNLTGGIAHDFNNLLMAVLGSLELLRKRLPQDPGIVRLLDNAMNGAQRGASLTRRMLTFARQQDLNFEPVDLNELVGGMSELMERSLGPIIAVEIDLAPDLPSVETDRNQLESALLNLAVNARDAMNGEGRIVIAGREMTPTGRASSLQPGRYICLSVTDTGHGMDEATLKKATDPFFTTKEVGRGTGLGLSMVHGFAEQSGGTLILKSAPGAGTTAEIWLPARSVEVPTYHDNGLAAETVGGSQRTLSVLAVDDDDMVLMSTCELLEDLGHRVTFARCGREALDSIGRAPFDLVITDHAMPEMTGAQLATALRASKPDLPIILASGYADLPPGTADGIPRLAKPFSLSALAEAIDKAIPA
ncbi:ATP-binding protein [Flaviflagellibacter deserti]|uniref:histidine kinase n=1 Tax=Flaviflagellibacter deserti TaxID=2267266 RepID=A0ABV9Z440_9HYPH